MTLQFAKVFDLKTKFVNGHIISDFVTNSIFFSFRFRANH